MYNTEAAIIERTRMFSHQLDPYDQHCHKYQRFKPLDINEEVGEHINHVILQRHGEHKHTEALK
jgi:hypothetical protein